MRNIKIAGLIALVFLIVLICLFVKLAIIPEITSERKVLYYTVDSIYTEPLSPNDIIFTSKKDSIQMYINRGLEEHKLDYFISSLLNKPACYKVNHYQSGSGKIMEISRDSVIIYKSRNQ
ncbi:MAG: hypothetical protein FWH18_03830 [Marinilabiliaceae bacterium]|nr:hypothetical protein [Marinilabiliaceae bacterium]